MNLIFLNALFINNLGFYPQNTVFYTAVFFVLFVFIRFLLLQMGDMIIAVYLKKKKKENCQHMSKLHLHSDSRAAASVKRPKEAEEAVKEAWFWSGASGDDCF